MTVIKEWGKKGGTIWCMDNTAHSKATVSNRLQVQDKLQFSQDWFKAATRDKIKQEP